MKQKLLILFLFITNLTWAQQQDSTKTGKSITNWKTTSFKIKSDTLLLDSLPIFPNSLTLQSGSTTLPDSTYKIEGNKIIFLRKPQDTLLQARFRVFPFALTEKRQHKDLSDIGKSVQHDGLIGGNSYTYNPFALGADAFNFSDLDYSGVFARGISLGNSQDLILNSNFNLQVSGKLGDIEILAAISDNNIPLQPEGNTQQLQDFDRIFVQFKYKRQSLIAGDYNISRPKGSYFANYYRRLQGGQVFTDFKLGKNARLKTDVSFAISKGKFARNLFAGVEGNQGPYRLKGSSGEQFIIIVAGTERIFIDGKLLTRGADNDYVIDYNLGELTFTAQQLITKDKRIQVEFSYTDLTFLRTLATVNMNYETRKTNIRFNFYSEQDAKGQTVAESLSDSAKAVLQRIGDNLDQAYTSGIRIPNPDDERAGVIFYKLIDTLVNNILYDSVLVFSNNPDSAIYTARFALITSGGDYIRNQGTANGVVYQWVAPDPITGAPRGTHAPLQALTTPKEQQLYNLGMDYKITKNGIISADFAVSNVDRNTFSEVGNEDNQGFAGRLSYQQKIPLNWDKKTENDTNFYAPADTIFGTNDSAVVVANNSLNIQAHYEYLMKEFEYVEPYRTREFSRDWNINLPTPTQEHWYKINLNLEGRKWGNVGYEFGGLNKQNQYSGYRHTLDLNTRYKGLNIISNSSLLHSQTETEKSLFIRPKLDVSYTFDKLLHWKIGAYAELEQNARINMDTDTLIAGSFFYNFFKIYTELPASKNLSISAYYIRRYDYTAEQQDFSNNAVADDVNLAGEWSVSKASQLKWNLSYRNLRISDSTLTIEEPKETYLGRLEYILNIKDGFIHSNTIYQLGSGQQQKIEYSYIKVNQGQGTHIWVDRNGDEAQQTSEFEESIFKDQADYVRLTLLTGQFIRTNNVLFSQSLNITPKSLIQSIRKKKEITTKMPMGLDFLQRLSTRSIFKIDRRTFDGAQGVLAFNPFQFDVADTALVSISSSIQNNLYFNRTGTYSLEFGQRDSKTKTLLSTGFETRNLSEYMLRQRLNIKPGIPKPGQKPTAAMRNIRLQALLTGTLGFQGNYSEFYPSRAYDIRYYKMEPQFTFLFKEFFRTVVQYNFKFKENTIGALEKATSHDITTEITYSKSSKTNIRASFSVVLLNFNGDVSTPVGYTMTEGLQSGTNYLWNVSFAQALSQNIQMTLSYEGRKTGENSPVIHVGRAEIRATF